MSKDAFYLKHDYAARNDPKMVKLVRVCGWEGSGLAWAIVEMLYENGGRISHDPEQIAYDLRTEQAKIEAVVACPVFFVRDGMIGSERVDRELDERREAQRQASVAGKASAAARSAQRALNDRSTDLQPGEERRGEERRGEDINDGAKAPGDLTKAALKAQERAALSIAAQAAQLPCEFDGYPKGLRIVDLSAEDLGRYLKVLPPSDRLTQIVKFIIAEKKAEGIKK